MDSVIVYYDEVEKVLKSNGYEEGYSAISNDVMDCFKYVVFYNGSTVISVCESSGIVKKMKLCNTERECNTGYGVRTLLEVKNWLKGAMKYSDGVPATILSTFTKILFEEYDPAVEKYNKIMQEYPYFSPGFKELFQKEIDAMTTDNTQMAEIPHVHDWFRSRMDGKYWNVTVVNKTQIVLNDFTYSIGCSKLFDLREVMNQFNRVGSYPDADALLNEILSQLHWLTNATEIVHWLKTLGHRGLEALGALRSPVHGSNETVTCVFSDFDGYACVSVGDVMAKCFLSGCISGDVSIDTDVRVSASLPTERVEVHFESAVKPYIYLDVVRGLNSNLLIKFVPVLAKNREVQQYLYSLHQALQQVEDPITEINYEADWSQFSESETTLGLEGGENDEKLPRLGGGKGSMLERLKFF